MELKNTFRNITIVGLGGAWAMAVAIARDANGADKVRVAKGRYASMAPLKKGQVKEIAGPIEELPITQPNKLNLKRRDEWDFVNGAILAALDQLEAAPKK